MIKLLKDLINNPKVVLLLCITLGMAPFQPEPHLFGKIRWIAGGAEGMQLIDWLDVFLHGTPFILLTRLVLRSLLGRNQKVNPNEK